MSSSRLDEQDRERREQAKRLFDQVIACEPNESCRNLAELLVALGAALRSAGLMNRVINAPVEASSFATEIAKSILANACRNAPVDFIAQSLHYRLQDLEELRLFWYRVSVSVFPSAPPRDDAKAPSFTQPDNPDVRDLCHLLAKQFGKGKPLIQIAREFTREKPGNDKKARSLLRQARRFSHLWKRADN